MTTREFYLSVIDAHISDDATEKARELLASLDARNEKRKSADSKEKREVRARVDAVYSALDASPTLAETVAESVGVTVGQARSALSALVREGRAVKVNVKVDKARRVAYVRAEDMAQFLPHEVSV